MNEYCEYPNRHFDTLLKYKYDYKHDIVDNQTSGRTFLFGERKKSKKKY